MKRFTLEGIDKDELEKQLLETLKERRCEANKIYNLGLRNFISHKKKVCKGLKNVQMSEKLTKMLTEYHMERLNRILEIKSLEQRIYETEFLILRYQINCILAASDDNN